MAFRLINNRAQDIAVKGFVATIILAVVLQLFGVFTLSITLPFIMPWLVVWLIGYSMINKSGEDDETES